jgi:hypothetical protein
MHECPWQGTRRWLNGFVAFAGFTIVVVGAALRAPADIPPALKFAESGIDFVRGQAWWLLISAVAGSWAARAIVSKLPDRRSWDVTKAILDQFRASVFQEEDGDPIHYHKVTLFKHVGWIWAIPPRGGWLVSIIRSGHTDLRKHIRFRAPDRADEAEGIAGAAWAAQTEVYVDNLPDILWQYATPKDVETYATRTHMTKQRAQRDRPAARSLCGFHVEMRGKPWGVIVLSSRSESMDRVEAGRYFGGIAQTLSILVEDL